MMTIYMAIIGGQVWSYYEYEPIFDGGIVYNTSAFYPSSNVSGLELFYFNNEAYVSCNSNTDETWETYSCGGYCHQMICPVLDSVNYTNVTFLAYELFQVFGYGPSLQCSSNCIGVNYNLFLDVENAEVFANEERHRRTLNSNPIFIALIDETTANKIKISLEGDNSAFASQMVTIVLENGFPLRVLGLVFALSCCGFIIFACLYSVVKKGEGDPASQPSNGPERTPLLPVAQIISPNEAQTRY